MKNISRVALFVLVTLYGILPSNAATSYFWEGTNVVNPSDWFNSSNWTPHGVPGAADTASVTHGYVDIGNANFSIANLYVTGGTLSGAGTMTVTGNMNWTDGNLAGEGRTIIDTGAKLYLGGVGGSGVLVYRTLENAGTIYWNGAAPINGSFGVAITNRTGAVFEIQNDSDITAPFDNAGTIRKVEATGMTTFGAWLRNFASGVVDIQSGSLRLATRFTSSGAIKNGSGCIIEMDDTTISEGGSLQGVGLYKVTGALTVNNNVSVANLDLKSGVILGGGALTVSGTMNWTSGYMQGEGRTIIDTGAVLNLGGVGGLGVTLYRTLENAGSVYWTGPGLIGGSTAVGITNRFGALFEIQNDSDISASFDNAGTIRKVTATGMTSFGGLNNYATGVVDIQSGTLLLASRVASSGSITNKTGCVIEIYDTTISDGGNLSGAGVYKITGALTVNNDVSVANLDLKGGVILGGGTITVSGIMNWTSGSMQGDGRTVINTGAVLNLGGVGGLGVSVARTLENAGSVYWTGPGLINGSAAVAITNRVGALFEIQNDTDISGPRFDNAGTIRKVTATGTTTFGARLNNYASGVMDIQSGTLQLASPVASSGSIRNGSGSIIEISDTTMTGGGNFSGTGLFKIMGALTVDNTISVANLDLNAGVLTGGGSVTVTGIMNWTGGSMQGEGRTIIDSAATLNLGGGSNFGVVLNRTLENAGSAYWNGTGTISGNTSGVITNRFGGLVVMQNDATLDGVRLDNSGTVRKTQSTGTTVLNFNVVFNNFGVLDIRSGKIAVLGQYVPDSSSTHFCDIRGPNQRTDYGQLEVSGNLALSGRLQINLKSGYTPASQSSFPIINCVSRSGIFTSANGRIIAGGLVFHPQYLTTGVTLQVADSTPTFGKDQIATSNGHPVMRLQGIPGELYRIDVATNLVAPVNWIPISTNSIPSPGYLDYADEISPGATNRFYRSEFLP